MKCGKCGKQEVINLIDDASDNIELALTRLHFYKNSEELQISVKRLGINALQALSLFPEIRDSIMEK